MIHVKWTSLGKSQDSCSQEDIHEGDFEDVDPAELHQLVVAEARKRPADPNEEEEQSGDLCEEDDNAHDAPDPAGYPAGSAGRDERQMPATEEEYDDEGASGDHRGVFAEEEQGELHRRVFRVISPDEFGLGLRQVERKAVRLCEHADREGDEGDEDRNPEKDFAEGGEMPVGKWDEHPTVRNLVVGDLGEARRSCDEQNRQGAETETEFVANHLR